MLIPVILSGGAGTRLWPVSREAHPKPFMRLSDGQSLLQKTLRRAAALDGVGEVLTITSREHYFKTRDEYEAVGPRSMRFDYVLEPFGRNTAPAIAVAALRLMETAGPEAVMLVLAADHLINDQGAFAAAVARAQRLAEQGKLVTFGIRPHCPETGYGYIEAGVPCAAEDPGCVAAHMVSRFVEKPTQALAEEYLASNNFLWNSGMFCFRADAYLAALERNAEDVYRAAEACWSATHRDVDPIELDSDAFAAVPDISVDYAVMERAADVAVVIGGFDWSDIGSWTAISDLQDADAAGNRIARDQAAILIDATNCYLQSEDRLIAAVGVDDLLIVDTPDALLVARRDRAQDVKQVVQQLKSSNHEAYRLHRTVSRPWGTYTVLEEGDRFKIKRIVVKPRASLSLQMHHHRSEHWVVVRGTAKVVNGDGERLVRTNESTYIPIGAPHRLMNPGLIDLVMIEVQSGEYLGEDDIVRFDDVYGRVRDT
jgi:mannose-1-phosphate guanylyltransferase / mannose-6-phosphate isomerase